MRFEQLRLRTNRSCICFEELDSPERAIDAYLKLRAASHISIAADRAGRRIQLDYDVR